MYILEEKILTERQNLSNYKSERKIRRIIYDRQKRRTEGKYSL